MRQQAGCYRRDVEDAVPYGLRFGFFDTLAARHETGGFFTRKSRFVKVPLTAVPPPGKLKGHRKIQDTYRLNAANADNLLRLLPLPLGEVPRRGGEGVFPLSHGLWPCQLS